MTIKSEAQASAGAGAATLRPKLVIPFESARSTGSPAASTAPSSLQKEPGTRADPIAQFIELEMEARKCASLDELRFAIVNATRKIVAFEQAFLIEPGGGGGNAVTRVSDVSSFDRRAPLIVAVDAWLAHAEHRVLLLRSDPRQANIGHEAARWGLDAGAFDSPYAFWLPVKARDGRVLASILFLRRESWRPQEMSLLFPMASVYAHAWEALLPRHADGVAMARRVISRRWLALCASIAAVVAAFVPVPLSTLAPSEVAAAQPVLVTAPLDGVIDDVLLPPGAWVEKDTPIVRFVDVKLRNDVEVARRNVAVAQARYFRTMQAATATQKDMQDLATTKAEFDVAQAELAYATEMLERTEVRASSAGLLIYAAKSDLLGKPIATGERLMEIGNPESTEIRVELPVSDAIVLKPGGRIALFLDGDPLRAVPGEVTRVSYRPVMSAEQQLVFKVHGRFDGEAIRTIGVRGVARISGDDVPLWFYLFRRPLAALRQRTGF